MKPKTRSRLLSTTVVPFVFGIGLVAAGCADGTTKANGGGCYAAACKACGACGGCNPCAAGACNPCNPCAAGCGAGGAMTECVVPRIACNPCAVKACSPCNPCNPCAANPCNPCAAKACNPCNPCAANPCNPCNPCAANPCNPCAANPCNPCGAGGGAELTDAEANDAYNCAKPAMVKAYGTSGVTAARQYTAWPNYAIMPYLSETHGGRYVNNYANPAGTAYGSYEDAGTLPAGSVLAKDSFSVNKQGRVMVGPLFVMNKMAAGFNADTLDWQYQMVMPDGTVFGTTNGAGSAKVQFCAECHNAMAEQDALWFIPEEYRR